MAKGALLTTILIHQGHLEKQVKLLFPGTEIQVDSRKKAQLKHPTTNKHQLELDVYVPKHKICFEFQDVYHYMTMWYVQKSLATVQVRDDVKKDTTKKKGITFVVIPCWWDGRVESLAGTVLFQRPDLHLTAVHSKVSPIPNNPNLNFFPDIGLPGVGELMLAAFPNRIVDLPPDTWWMGEKYDGIRCCWNPIESKAYSRAGWKIPVLTSIVKALPAIFVDGELWFGRGLYHNFYAIIKMSANELASWHYLRLVGFDVPSFDFQNLPFEKRYEHLVYNVLVSNSFCVVVARIKCTGNDLLTSAIQNIISDGGEGVILRKMGSKYERGRSQQVLKIKSSMGDKEGLVVEANEECVVLKLPNGQLLEVPIEDVYISTPMKGDIVSFSYEAQSRREVPIRPEIYRVRPDLSWEDVLLYSMQETKSTNDHLEYFTTNSAEYWTDEQMRYYMEEVARSFNKDPLHPTTWYTIPYKEIYRSKAGKAILKKFNGHYTALQELFPEISLDSSKLQLLKTEAQYRRAKFEKYAKENGFDFHNPDEWYLQPYSKLLGSKALASIISNYYRGSPSRALLTLFPDIGLSKKKFSEPLAWKYATPASRRKVFIGYAREKGFDPLVADNWYIQPRKVIYSKAYMVLAFHKYSVAKALLDLFPDIGLDRNRLLRSISHEYSIYTKSGKRKIMQRYAQTKGFDPLEAEPWLAQPTEHILAAKGVARVVQYYENSLPIALTQLFPEIRMDNFQKIRSRWNHSHERRNFFEGYAREQGFDPLIANMWYTQSPKSILGRENAHSVLWYHQGNLVNALLELFPEIGLSKPKLLRKINFRSSKP